MVKLIASDMDGTLINNQHSISPETVAAIEEAQQNGIEFIIATGRDYKDSFPVVKAQGIECKYIVMNGGELRDESGNVLQTLYMDQSLVKQVTKVLSDNDLYIEYYTDDGVYTPSSLEICKRAVATKINFFYPEISLDVAYEMSGEHSEFTKLKRIESVEKLYEINIEVGKILSFSSDEELLAGLRESIPTRINACATGSFPINLEITDVNASKGQAIKRYAKSKGISLHEVMCIGDSFNDETMLTEEFGVTVAMGNAHDSIKAIAKYVTGSNDENGVGQAIKKFCNY